MLEPVIAAGLLVLIMTMMYEFMLVWMTCELGSTRPAVKPSSVVVKNDNRHL